METTSEEPCPAAFVAIDWADAKHTVALLPADSDTPEHTYLDQKPEVLLQWIIQLRQRFRGAPVALILEQKRGALIHALMGHEFLRLYPVNPKMLSDFRKAFRISGAKDDTGDAMLLLELLLKHRDRLQRWLPNDDQTRLLTMLVEDRRAAVNERTSRSFADLAVLKFFA
jgi:hypothetical protein